MTEATVPSGTKVIYSGNLTHLFGVIMTVRYRNSCGSCRHGGTYTLDYTDPADGIRKELGRVLRTSFSLAIEGT